MRRLSIIDWMRWDVGMYGTCHCNPNSDNDDMAKALMHVSAADECGFAKRRQARSRSYRVQQFIGSKCDVLFVRVCERDRAAWWWVAHSIHNSHLNELGCGNRISVSSRVFFQLVEQQTLTFIPYVLTHCHVIFMIFLLVHDWCASDVGDCCAIKIWKSPRKKTRRNTTLKKKRETERQLAIGVCLLCVVCTHGHRIHWTLSRIKGHELVDR